MITILTNDSKQVAVALRSTTPPENIGSLSRLIEQSGFTELLLPEEYLYFGSMSTTVEVLKSTNNIRVVHGIVSALVRHPALLASEIATIERMYPGRIISGIGPGLPGWMQQMGLNPKSILKPLRECITIMRGLLEGKKTNYAGEYFQVHDMELFHPPEVAPPIYMGATGPNMVRLSGEISDGTLTSVLASKSYVKWIRENVEAAKTKGFRSNKHHKIRAKMFYSVDSDSRKAKERVRKVVAQYLSLMVGSKLLEIYGINDEVSNMVSRGNSDAISLIEREMPNQWVEDLAIAGNPDECADKIRGLHETGADSVDLTLIGEDLKESIKMTGEDVLPQLKL